MRARLKALARLSTLYEIVQHADGVAVDQARGALYEVEAKIREKDAMASRLLALSEEALRLGDLREWQIDQSQIEFTQWNASALEGLRQRREAAMREAAEVYLASRMQMEQVQSVVGEVRSNVTRSEGRAEQRAADDRYLSRQRWQKRADERGRISPERAAEADEREAFGRTI